MIDERIDNGKNQFKSEEIEVKICEKEVKEKYALQRSEDDRKYGWCCCFWCQCVHAYSS